MLDYKNQRRIIIIGPPASGKTFLSKKLKDKLRFKLSSLDNFFWDKKFSLKSNEKKRNQKLNHFLKKNKTWIIEGVYWGNWLKVLYEKTDLVIYLDTPKKTLASRLIFKRYLKKKKNLVSIKGWKRIKLIIFNTDLIREKIVKFLDKKSIKKKTTVLKNVKEINQFLKSIN